MEWLTAIRTAIDYIEENLTGRITVQEVSERVYLSPMHFQRGFQVMTGCSVSEYVRCRRLYLAALELKNTDKKVIDVAFDYGYETPESFTKAFTRFHGATPAQVRQGGSFTTFLPISVRVTVQGGNSVNCKIMNKTGFRVIGFAREFAAETAQAEIPGFWDEIFERYAANVWAGKEPRSPQERALKDCGIGEYGVCIDDPDSKGRFTYLIAGNYTGGEVPEGLTVLELPEGDWAVFDCAGPIPGAIQELTNRIFREWLPGNPDYELRAGADVEWYDPANPADGSPEQHTAVWIPVRRK